jgi:ribosome-interacting GTPase 1
VVPTNVSPEYKKAEEAYRRARDPKERLELLREMQRTIPKHKGTEHLQADIKSRIKEITDELAGPRRTGARTGPPTVIKPEGAAQVALLGPPNTGKSALHVALTGSHAPIGEHPFATQWPVPGMLPHEDIAIQLVDLPSIATTHEIPWIGNALQHADAAALVIDLGHAGCVAEVIELHEMLAGRKVFLHDTWPADGNVAEDADPFSTHLPTVIIANKADQINDVTTELEVFRELTSYPYPSLVTSATTGAGLDGVGAWLFGRLGIVRVYTKIPHQPPDMGRPYALRHGGRVVDLALLVHRDLAASFRFARIWGSGDFDGQQVGADHVLVDGDVVELHA